MTRRRVVHMILACSAAAGLVGAHAIAYLIALPDAAVRAAMLRSTGHGYLSVAVVMATVAAMFGAIAAAALGFRRGEGGERVIVRWRHASVRIGFVQSGAFVALEVAERAAANISPVGVGPRLLGLGIAIQIVLACLAALVLTLIGRAAAAVADVCLSPPAAGRSLRRLVRVFDTLGPRPASAGALHARAPPSSSR